MALLEVKDLSVYYGVINALKGVSFEVNEGEIVTLIGANGAGKTTTMQSVIGLIPSRGGSIIYDGKDISKMPSIISRSTEANVKFKGSLMIPEVRIQDIEGIFLLFSNDKSKTDE